MTIEEETEIWDQRSRDEFGTVLTEIKNATADYFYAEEDELGLRSTPIDYDIAAYALDGNRKSTARVIYKKLHEYDLFADKKVKALADKMMAVANA